MFVCTELIEYTGGFRKLIFGKCTKFPPFNKLRFPGGNFHTSQNYDVISGFSGSVKSHINSYNSHPNNAENLKL